MIENSSEKENMFTQTIGGITLDLSHYPGEDYYSDGSVEEELLSIVKNCSTSEYGRVIEERGSWPILYHLSPLRENIVDWLPIRKTDKVLEVGSGCGAITGALSRKAGSVDCVDLSKRRSLVNAYRHEDSTNVTIHVGNFKDIEPDLDTDYDMICLIGVFEYANGYIGGKSAYEDFLTILKKHLKEGGRIAIAIESRLGLKYWAGCKEDHVGKLFAGLEDYPEGGVARTFTRNGLLAIAEKCGFSKEECHMYYPYPDYKFMNTLFSDDRLPKVGELKDNLRNFDRDRLQLFDEKAVFDSLIKEGEFPLFSNSYMLLLGKESDVIYARYSNDRSSATAIRTTIRTAQTKEGKQAFVEKAAMSEASCEHLERMAENYALLKDRYAGGSLEICPMEIAEDGSGVFFPCVPGESLEAKLDQCVAVQDTEEFERLFREYYERISYGEEKPVADMDLIFSNVLIDGDTWTAIDYEWVSKKQVPASQVAFRALYCYLLEDERRNSMDIDQILADLGITPEKAESYREDEMSFQKEVTDSHMSLGEIRERIGNQVVDVASLEKAGGIVPKGKQRLQVYWDLGDGFKEEQSVFPKLTGGKYRVELPAGCVRLRIDPSSSPCMAELQEISLLDANQNVKNLMELEKNFYANGSRLAGGVYVFGSEDPNVEIPLENKLLRESTLELSVGITAIPSTVAEKLPEVKPQGRLAKIFSKL